MKIFIQNFIAIITGAVVGSIVNMGIIRISSSVIPPPAGADVTTVEGLKASMHLFTPKNFIMPFLAHALGTLAGALLATILGKNKMYCALAVGILFLIGGVANVFMLPSPLWFNLVDIVFAYLPMAYMGFKIALKMKSDTTIQEN